MRPSTSDDELRAAEYLTTPAGDIVAVLCAINAVLTTTLTTSDTYGPERGGKGQGAHSSAILFSASRLSYIGSRGRARARRTNLRVVLTVDAQDDRDS